MINGVTSPRLRGMLELCKEEVSTFDIKFKDESSMMKLLNVFAHLFNKTFMTEYTTTVGDTVYFPSRAKLLVDQEMYAEVLAHELVHMKEKGESGLVSYTLRYFFPQFLAVLSLLSIGAIWSPWFLLALVFLVTLAPLPAPGRRDIELDGYVMSMAVDYWLSGQVSDDELNWLADQFTTSAYYFMWPFRSDMLHRLKVKAIYVRTDSILVEPLFRKVRDVYLSAR